LDYLTTSFNTQIFQCKDFQGTAGIHYTEEKIPYTRSIEHKHFEKSRLDEDITVVTREFPIKWDLTKDPYYPVCDEVNKRNYLKYKDISDSQTRVIFGGRLAEYKYYYMEQIIRSALSIVSRLLQK